MAAERGKTHGGAGAGRITETVGVSVFEQLRQERETGNEKRINLLRNIMLIVIVTGHLVARLFPHAPHPPARVTLLLAVMLLLSLVSTAYLRRNPPYHAWRKYVIGGADSVYITLLFVFNIGSLSPSALYFMPIGLYAMLIVLSGLRYSAGAVWFIGSLSLVGHGLFLAVYGVFSQDAVAAVAVGVTVYSMVTASVGYSVSSLIGLHREAAQKEWLRRFLTPELADLVAENPELLERQTERRYATVLFTDIFGFTTLSEQLPPEQIGVVLNPFLEEMTAAILAHGGMLDKYIGDAVMGVFGVPFPAADDAKRALAAAVEMRQRLTALNERFAQANLPALNCGIGLHTGDLVAGTIGSTQRLEYTVIGDTVNVASRLESLTRQYPFPILLSDTTRLALGENVALRSVATTTVKGRKEPIALWTPME